MNLGKTFYAKNRKEWRKWLEKNHAKAKEIWLVYYKKSSGKPRVEYGDAVDEALCFGWIDSTVKTVDKDRFAQRFSPRNPKSDWSELNKEKARRLFKAGLMHPAGLAMTKGHHTAESAGKIIIPKWLEKTMKKDTRVWNNFKKFPEHYRRIRIAWITASAWNTGRKTRLAYFLKMTAQNKKYGMLQ